MKKSVIFEYVVHKGLEHMGALMSPIGMTRNSKGHSVFGRLSSLVAHCNTNIVVASTEVKLCVDLCTAQW